MGLVVYVKVSNTFWFGSLDRIVPFHHCLRLQDLMVDRRGMGAFLSILVSLGLREADFHLAT